MKHSIETMANLAEMIYSHYRYGGQDEFLVELKRNLQFIGKKNIHDVPEINIRYTALISMLLAKFLQNDANAVLKEQIAICERALNSTDIEEKVVNLVEDMSYFLRRYEAGDMRLSDDVLSFISNCSHEELRQVSVEALARKYQYSPEHFSRKIKCEQDVQIGSIILGEKLNRVFVMLTSSGPSLSIEEIAGQFGFNDLRYFRSKFKQ